MTARTYPLVLILHLSGLLLAGRIPLVGQSIKVFGQVRWTDSAGNAHPIRNAPVEIWDSDRAARLASDTTDDRGNYHVKFTPLVAPQRVHAQVFARTASAQVKGDPTSPPYSLQSAAAQVAALVRADIVGDRLTDGTSNAAFSVLDAVGYGASFVARVGGRRLNSLEIRFPASKSSRFDGQRLHIHAGDRWDWDVVLHEYGHYVAREFRITLATSGAHRFDQNLGLSNKTEGIRLAWAEGWPTYFAVAVQQEAGLKMLGIAGVGDAVYQDTENKNIWIALNSHDPDWSLGEDNEVTVMRILHDLTDNDPGRDLLDHVSLGYKVVWRWLVDARPASLSDAWAALSLNPPGKLDEFSAVMATHRAAPVLLAPAEKTRVATGLAFSWSRNSFDRFVLKIVDADGYVILSTPRMSENSYRLRDEEQSLINARTASGPLRWYVLAWNSKSPETGPYRSPSRSLMP